MGLKSRNVNVIENSEIKLICSVIAPKVSLAVTWTFEPRNSTTQKLIICMDQTGSISCGVEQQDYQLVTQVKDSGTAFILRVLRASQRHGGRYACQIDAYDKKVQKTKKLSNQLAITIVRPGMITHATHVGHKFPILVLETPVLHIFVFSLFATTKFK